MASNTDTPRANTARHRVDRRTVDLSPYPDLVVIYLGMRASSLRGLWTMFRFGPEIRRSVAAKPDGLLLHEDLMYSLVPFHVGMRQYWRDLDALEAWSRQLPHQQWWQDFLRDPAGTGFWHETYCRTGGIEAIYDDVAKPIGMARFARTVHAHGPMFSARTRLDPTRAAPPAPVRESDLA
jgi:fumigallin biosynthesis monooxygenase-like protein